MKVRLLLFNHVNNDGKVYVAESAEEIEKLFGKQAGYSSKFLVNAPVIDPELTYKERFSKVSSPDITQICGGFEDFEIIETDDRGYDDFPVFEVYGTLKVLDSENGKNFENLYKENLTSIRVRGWSRTITENVESIGKIICWDVFPRKDKK